MRRQCLRFALYLKSENEKINQNFKLKTTIKTKILKWKRKIKTKNNRRKKAKEPDGVVGAHTDPVRDGPILPHLLGQLLLDYEGLVRRLCTLTKPIIRNRAHSAKNIQRPRLTNSFIADYRQRESEEDSPFSSSDNRRNEGSAQRATIRNLEKKETLDRKACSFIWTVLKRSIDCGWVKRAHHRLLIIGLFAGVSMGLKTNGFRLFLLLIHKLLLTGPNRPNQSIPHLINLVNLFPPGHSRTFPTLSLSLSPMLFT